MPLMVHSHSLICALLLQEKAINDVIKSLNEREDWKEYYRQEFVTKAKKEVETKEDCLKRLYLSFKQEEDFHKR